MSPSADRPFTLADALALLGSAAVGLWGLRSSVGGLEELRLELVESVLAFAGPANGWSVWSWVLYSGFGFVATVLFPFCWSLTLTLLVLRLRRPRPPLRRLALQPGFIACCSAALALVPALLGLIYMDLILGFPSRVDLESPAWQKGLSAFFLLLPSLTGFSVLGAWAALFVGGRLRADPSWLDRAGRLVGLYWICAIPLPAWGLL